MASHGRATRWPLRKSHRAARSATLALGEPASVPYDESRENGRSSTGRTMSIGFLIPDRANASSPQEVSSTGPPLPVVSIPAGSRHRLMPLEGKPVGTLLVHEIYRSLQGESTFAGLPCVFVR